MKNTKYITCLAIVALTLLLAWLLPWAYRLLNTQKNSYPFAYYSSVAHSFCYIDSDNDQPIRMDATGKQYSEAEFDSILPMFYFRQLLKDGRLPDSINGVEVSPKVINTYNFFFRYKPDLANTPAIKLFPLFESMNRRVDLQMPGDVFRIDVNGITFIRPETNTIDQLKSDEFNSALLKQGFTPPARLIAGTPTTRKPYDEGYFIVDQNHLVFHLKMVNGHPFVRNTGVDADLKTSFILTTEYPSKLFYGFLIDAQNRLYTISTDEYQLKQVPIPSFSASTDNLLIMGNMFHWNVQVTSTVGQKTYAVDANSLALSDSIAFPSKIKAVSSVQQWLFPCAISFASVNDGYIKPRITSFGWQFFIVNLVLMISFLALNYRTHNLAQLIVPALFIAITGLFGFISILFINPLKTIS